MKKLLLFGCLGCGCLIFIIIVVMAIGVTWLVSGPEGGVQLPNNLEPYAVKYIKDNKILEPSEELLAYYDETISLDGTEAALITTKRVIYHKNGNNESINIDDIEDIQHRKEALSGDIFEIYSTSGKVIKIEIAPLNQGETFKNILMKTREKAKSKNRTT
jgi:hypothetical protein